MFGDKNKIMEINKYKNDGWGLSLLGFSTLLEIIKNHEISNLRLLEFGSGTSTMFFSDIVKNKIKNLEITSFDDDDFYMYKASVEEEKYLKVLKRNLIQYSEFEYNKMFEENKINNSFGSIKNSASDVNQKNCFYDIKNDDLTGIYNMVILDGPNGNGRNIGFLHIKNYIKTGTILYIDDYNHYDFLEKCQAVFNIEILFKHTEGVGNGKDNFVIIKIL